MRRASARGAALAGALLALAWLAAAVPRATAQELPSPGTARSISLGATLLPLAAGAGLYASDHEGTGTLLLVGGVVLGPAAGYVYGDRAGRGLAGALLRVAVAGGGYGLAYLIVGRDEEIGDIGTALTVLALAGLVVTTSAAVDIVRVAANVEARNAERRAAGEAGLRVPAPGAPGLALRASVRF